MQIRRFQREGESEDEDAKQGTLALEGSPMSDHALRSPPVGMAMLRESPGFSVDITSHASGALGAENIGDRECASSVRRPLPLSIGSSSFKLMPRNLSAIEQPFAFEEVSWGFLSSRKRRAYSIGSSSSCSDEEQQDFQSLAIWEGGLLFSFA